MTFFLNLVEFLKFLFISFKDFMDRNIFAYPMSCLIIYPTTLLWNKASFKSQVFLLDCLVYRGKIPSCKFKSLLNRWINVFSKCISTRWTVSSRNWTWFVYSIFWDDNLRSEHLMFDYILCDGNVNYSNQIKIFYRFQPPSSWFFLLVFFVFKFGINKYGFVVYF